MLEEFSFEGDKRLSKKSENVSSFYIVKNGGAILKGSTEDDIYMTGDLVDPVSLVTGKSTGDTYTIGSTTLMAGTSEEILTLLSRKPNYLLRLLKKVSETLSSALKRSKKRMRSTDEIVSYAISKRQVFLEKYRPLLFGEKSLYRKGVKLLERKDYDNALEIFKNYLSQFNNSPLTRPVKMFIAMTELKKGSFEKAVKMMMELLSEDSFDTISHYIRELFGTFDLGLSTLQITRQNIYSDNFYSYLQEKYPENKLELEKEEILFQEGVKSDKVVVLIEGKMNILKLLDRKTFFIKEISEKSTFGELHVLIGATSDVTVVIDAGSKIMLFEKDTFLKIITEKIPVEGTSLLERFLEFEDEILKK